ncbi:hypothetical protein F8388_025273 [Cannabis sativa]|uniref:peptidylprolyl isomerase n=1 Tax=Cannabis sativa TaxID=3483 RepID=A0A7J6FV59_CANSA|nr:hypothetical protein F8388_025273 [Cannabis sativa]
MKNLLKKLHIMSNQPEDVEGGSTSSRSNNKSIIDGSSPDRHLVPRSHHSSENKPFSGLSGWLNSVANRHSSNIRTERTELPSDEVSIVSGLDVSSSDVLRADSGSSNSRDPDVEEEYQIQIALEMSAREDPEAVQIEAVKQISLGSCAVDNTPAEVVAYRYWNYNALSYDDKILDGFYDLYGILTESTSERMPSLIDLQGTPVSEGVAWEAVLVNKAADSNLLKLEQVALEMAVKSRSDSLVFVNSDLVRKLAVLVANYMGGPVGNPENMLREWQNLTYNLKATHGSMVLPLGSLKIGLARHRALLFKVLADSVTIPCRLVKGPQYTGSSDVAMNFVKINGGREYIVDLMSDPGTLIPSDAAGSHIEYDDSCFSASPLSRDIDSSHVASSSSGVGSSFEDHSDFGTFENKSRLRNPHSTGRDSDDKEELTAHSQLPVESKVEETKAEGESKILSDDFKKPLNAEKGLVWDFPNKSSYPHGHGHARSPSWTEGVGSPAVRKKKVKDVSKYMIDAAKENPKLAQKLHDVLLESGVIAPPNLFTEIYQDHLDASTAEANAQKDYAGETKEGSGSGNRENRGQDDIARPSFLPPLPHHKVHTKTNSPGQQELLKLVEGLGVNLGRSGDREHDAVVGTNSEGERVSDKSVGNDSSRSDSIDDVAECEIPWDEITMGERIGLGSYGEVYRGEWHGTDVAVKRFLDQDISGESLVEFMKEVRIMKRLRHPNVVLFMGAVTRTPNLSIVTEFLPRGSLYRLLHRPNNQLDERRRLRMALDAVCDFGLSKIKHSTFLSSRSTAGTAEWMAPEVLRNEPSDEKCDVYSFGVILWELSTMQQPWGGMNPMQVVGAVGFQHRRLDIPDDMDPAIADIIRKCWQTNVEEEEEVVLPNGIRYVELKLGGGATPRPGDLVVIDLQGKVEGSGEVFVDTFEKDKKPLALVLGSRPYSKGVCEGIEKWC